MGRTKHVFTIEVEFDNSEEYENFLSMLGSHGGEIIDETSEEV